MLRTLSKYWSENCKLQTLPKYRCERNHQHDKNSNRYLPKHKFAGDAFTLELILTMIKKLLVTNVVSRCWRITFRDIWTRPVETNVWMLTQSTNSSKISMRRLSDSLACSEAISEETITSLAVDTLYEAADVLYEAAKVYLNRFN